MGLLGQSESAHSSSLVNEDRGRMWRTMVAVFEVKRGNPREILLKKVFLKIRAEIEVYL